MELNLNLFDDRERMDLLALPSVVRSSLVALTWYKTLNEYDWDGDLLEQARFFLERSINPQAPG